VRITYHHEEANSSKVFWPESGEHLEKVTIGRNPFVGVLGAHVGVTGGILFTNAENPNDLQGPATGISFHGGFGLDIGVHLTLYRNGIWTFALTGGYGYGLSGAIQNLV
jgi:hypothetical protein